MGQKRRKITLPFLLKEFFSIGYTLVSSKYDTNKTQLRYVCNEGHTSLTTWSRFNTGHRCQECAGLKKKDYFFILDEFNKRGYTLISKEYVNAQALLEYSCPKGHIGFVRWNDFRRGDGCSACAGVRKKTLEEVKELLSSYDYTLLSKTYKDNKHPLDMLCNKGHRISVRLDGFVSGKRCNTCFNISHTSKAEQEIYEMVCEALGEDKVIHNDRTVIGPKELDIYVPEKKFAIEYCGLYWHSQVSGKKEPRYHYDKQVACNEQGIRLMTIFEDEYRDRKEVVVSRIKNAVGAYERRVFARKCTFGVPVKAQVTEMMKSYHLQGTIGSKYQFGLFYHGELIQAMTFGSPARHHTAKGLGKLIEMKRMVTVPGISIPGGASKIFKHSCDILRAEGYQTVKSYCDMRYANQVKPVYETLGFNIVGQTFWTPHYHLDGRRVRNQGLRKTPEERLTGLTEWQLRKAEGYDRLWDTGHRTYVLFLVPESEVS